MFGSQVAYGVESAPGMCLVAVADLDRETAVGTFERAGVPVSAVETGRSGGPLTADDRAVFDDGVALVDADPDVVVEATGAPEAAVRHALAAITRGVDVVNVSVEADAVVGPVLARLAERAGVTYSMAYGDQPAKIVDLYDWARVTGLEVVAAGRTTQGLDIDPHGTPEDALDRYNWTEPPVDGIDPTPTMINSFVDGTKLAASPAPSRTPSASARTSPGCTCRGWPAPTPRRSSGPPPTVASSNAGTGAWWTVST
jgi:predicted homoserine dehydrogenase-like protein